MREAVIVAAVRTAVGKAPSGALCSVRPDELAAAVIAEALRRAPGLDPALVDDVMLGCAMPEAEQGLNVARIASLRAGVPVATSAVTINRFCASGLQAIAVASDRIICGAADVVIAGGIESMSLIPMGGHKVSPNPALVESYPDVYLTTGLVAENHARECGISREEQDAFALRSHQRALAAIDAGRFRDEIVPVPVTIVEPAADAAGPMARAFVFDADEGPRRDTSAEALAGLKPAFHAAGTVTAGNSSQMSDGAAAVIVMAAELAEALGLRPLARFVGYATAGVEPERFGIGPVPAIRKLLARTGLSLDGIDLVELNEAFAVAGPGVPAGVADRSGPPERQRRRDRAGSPAGLHRREADDDARARDAAPRRALRSRDDVRGRRHGRGGDLREMGMTEHWKGWTLAWVVALATLAVVSCSSAPADPNADYAAKLQASRSAKDEAFRRQVDQPIPADRMRDLLPLRYFPPDPSFVVPASFTPAATRPPVRMPTSTGQIRDMELVGTLEFTLKGRALSLGAFVESGTPPDQLFVPFTDLTSGTETYAAGRYLEIARTATGIYSIDFNRAFQPYCAYNHTYDCPYPPASNRLPVAVRAGEKLAQPALPAAGR